MRVPVRNRRSDRPLDARGTGADGGATRNTATRNAPPSVRVPPPLREVRCMCGHIRLAHEHYRRGTDCGMCRCAEFSHGMPSNPWRP